MRRGGRAQGLLDATIAHDADGAVALLEAHMDRTRAIITDFSPGTHADDEPSAGRAS